MSLQWGCATPAVKFLLCVMGHCPLWNTAMFPACFQLCSWSGFLFVARLPFWRVGYSRKIVTALRRSQHVSTSAGAPLLKYEVHVIWTMDESAATFLGFEADFVLRLVTPTASTVDSTGTHTSFMTHTELH